MVSPKSDRIADEHRNAGNSMYQSARYDEALIFYNKSLCYAESSEKLALAFANRSAVYLSLGKHQECIDNIRLAREHGYPLHNMSKLDERVRKCEEENEPVEPKKSVEAREFFKLTYPRNDKIPFVVNCLELKQDDKFGRHIISNRDLNPGDIIAIEEPFKKSLSDEESYSRCNNCLKSNSLNLMPCTGKCTKSELTKVFSSKYS